MKKLVYFILRPGVYARWADIRRKQEKRLRCVRQARKILDSIHNKDKPIDRLVRMYISMSLSYPYGYSISDTYLAFFLTSTSDEDLARKLPLHWYK